MNADWLITNVIAVGSPAGAEHNFLGAIIFDVFWPTQAAIVVWEPQCDLKILSWAENFT